MVDVSTVGALNEVIANGGASNLILVQEALQEKKIAKIAEKIAEDSSRKFVMIADRHHRARLRFTQISYTASHIWHNTTSYIT